MNGSMALTMARLKVVVDNRGTLFHYTAHVHNKAYERTSVSMVSDDD